MDIGNIEEYIVLAELYSNDYYKLLKAKEHDGTDVLLKIPVSSDSEIIQRLYRLFIREIEIYNLLRNTDVVIPCRLISGKLFDFICYDLKGSILFSDIQSNESNKIEQGFYYLQNITAALGFIHNKEICHNNLTPYNIVVEAATGKIRFLNFIHSKSDLLADYRYISPELTNRVIRAKTVLTDFYSLGVIFYEFLFRHPIDTTSVKSLRRAHLTMNFPPLHKVDPQIPIFLSRIINRLLHKLPQMRYKNTYSLLHDLKMVEENYKTNQETQITLGEYNHISEIYFPIITSHFQKTIDTIFEHINANSSTNVLIYNISGSSEQGHDIFLNTFNTLCNKQIILRFSIVVENVAKELPFHTISILLKKLVYNLKYSRDDTIKDKLHSFLNNSNPRILSTLYFLCPDFNIILSLSKKDESINVLNDHRTIYVALKTFIQFVLSISRPLILHFAHIGNTDSDSMKLFISLCNDAEIKNIVFLFSSVDTHKKIRRLGNSLITNISIPDVSAFALKKQLGEVLRIANPEATQISENFITETINIYQIQKLLNDAYNQKALFYDMSMHSWAVDSDKIKLINKPISFKEYISQKFEDLTFLQKDILRYASIMGQMFDARTIAMVMEVDLSVVVSELWQIETECYIKPMTQFSRLKETENLVIYHFCNENLWEYIKSYSIENLHEIKLKLFVSLLDICERKPYHFILFEEFLYNNRPLMGELDEKHKYILLNYYCHKSKTFLSLRKLREAERNIQYCFDFLKPIAWLDKYYLTKEIYYIGLTIAYETNNIQLFDKLALDSAKQLQTSEDKFEFNFLRIKYNLKHQRLKDAEILIIQTLDMLNINIPVQDSIFFKLIYNINIAIFKNKLLNYELPQHSTEYIEHEEELCKLNVYSKQIGDNSYKRTIKYILFRTIKYGIKANYALPLLHFSKLLIEHNHYRFGMELAKQVVAANHTDKNISIDKKLYYYTQIHPYTERLNKSKEFFIEAVDYFLEYGNYHRAIYTCFHLVVQYVLGGSNLNSALTVADNQIKKIIHHSRSNTYFKLLQTFKNFCRVLVSYRQNFTIDLPEIHNNSSAITHYWFNLGMMLYFFYTDEFDNALKYSDNALSYSDKVDSGYTLNYIKFYQLLIKCHLIIGGNDNLITDKELRIELNELKRFSKLAPEIYQAQYLYTLGLYLKIQNKEKQMLATMKKSIQIASRDNYKNLEALSNRALARYYEEKGNQSMQQLHLVRAYNNYKSWGNNAVAQKIKLSHYSFFDEMEIRIYKIE